VNTASTDAVVPVNLRDAYLLNFQRILINQIVVPDDNTNN
jgi:hypothetical protein